MGRQSKKAKKREKRTWLQLLSPDARYNPNRTQHPTLFGKSEVLDFYHFIFFT